MKTVKMLWEDDSTEKFVRTDGERDNNPAVSFRRNNGARLSWIAPGLWKMSSPDGFQYTFLPCGYGHTTRCKLVEIRDTHGQMMTLERDAHSNLVSLTPRRAGSTSSTDENDRIIEGQDSTGRTVRYAYDAGDRLSEVRTSTGRVTRNYAYDDNAHLLRIEDAQDGLVLQNRYERDILMEQTLPSAGTYRYRYHAETPDWAKSRAEFCVPTVPR